MIQLELSSSCPKYRVFYICTRHSRTYDIHKIGYSKIEVK